jgi:hypothetical protein
MLTEGNLAAARHEAAHALCAYLSGLYVTHAVANDREAHVRCGAWAKHEPEAQAAVYEAQATVALAGAVIEPDRASIDEKNALASCLQAVTARGDVDPLFHEAEAERLRDRLRLRATSMLDENKPALCAIAAALAERGHLEHAEIDALIAACPLSGEQQT